MESQLQPLMVRVGLGSWSKDDWGKLLRGCRERKAASPNDALSSRGIVGQGGVLTMRAEFPADGEFLAFDLM